MCVILYDCQGPASERQSWTGVLSVNTLLRNKVLHRRLVSVHSCVSPYLQRHFLGKINCAHSDWETFETQELIET